MNYDALVFWQVVAAAIYLLPVVIVVIGVSRRSGSPAEYALWIPAALAFDLLTCLAAARLVSLSTAFVASRGAWLIVGSYWMLRKRHAISLPAGVGWRQILLIATCAIGAVCVSMTVSRHFGLWDRDLHVPLVTTLRNQRLPFTHVFQAHTVLHYHFTGDVLAGALQTFSAGRLHSDLTLSLAHDLLFGLFAVALASWLVASAAKLAWIVPAVLSVLLSGPFPLFRDDVAKRSDGFTYLNLFSMSFRPHVSLAALLILGMFAAIVLRVTGRVTSPRKTVICLFLGMATLGVTDEASAALFGVSLGITWLIFPHVLHPSRAVGLAILVGLAAAIIAANLLFQASLAPGSPVQEIRLMPSLTVPAVYGAKVPLFTRAGLDMLTLDMAPFVLVLAALVAVTVRNRRSWVRIVTLFVGAALLVSLTLLVSLEINRQAFENHRFMTINEVLFPMLAVLLLARLPAGEWQRIPLLAALFLSAVCTVYWANTALGQGGIMASERIDCRTMSGARLFEQPQATYVPNDSWFIYAGCRPAFTPGIATSWAKMQTSGPLVGRPAFLRLHQEFVTPGEALAVICKTTSSDPACRYARSKGGCVPSGTAFDQCQLSADDRARVLAGPW